MGAQHDFTSIPKLDLSLANDESTKPQLLEQLRYALVNVGFLYIVNHGIPEDVIAKVVLALPVLFALPTETKVEVAVDESPHFLGYSRNGTETTAGQIDRREQFEFATELDATWSGSGNIPLCERLRGPNQWPAAYPNLRPIVETYIAELTLLGERFLRLVAEALSLPSETLFSFLSDQHRLKLVRYPPATSKQEGDVQGVGPHKDSSGWWTFLLQASPPEVRGLQALNRAGAWIDVPVVPGSFVVNIGQAFEVVTNGVCRATTHRVVMTSSDNSDGSAQIPQERFSVPFFQGVRRDLTRDEAVGTLREHFARFRAMLSQDSGEVDDGGLEARKIDSPFLQGKYDTWGESQLRIKVRSHQAVGRRFYGEVFDKYMNDDL
ncbi:putative hyoscyamine 6-dioxygenase [Podospora didyma]|uniref:Hyoscyamine 6-dioxygenase n=1 Tax=Podospora didyma TaxID=330526 RepID=A0AAE0K5B4_9PEZI|nr:putative hyoscyamine 6-dioxygenase [Podospora didyma]